MSPVLRRIVAALGAHSFGQVINITIQLVSLPMFLHHWDTARYGVWLIMAALPTYVSMTDIGMTAIAGNRMTMEIARGQHAEANVTFQSAFAFMLIVCGSALAISVPIALFAPIKGLTTMDQRIGLAALFSSTVFAMFAGFNETVFKSTNRYAMGVMSYNFLRLGEWMGWMAGLSIFGTYAGVALTGLCVRIVGVGIATWVGHCNSQGLKWGLRHAKSSEIKGMFKPAISYMAFPMANALSVQGVTLLVGALFGPVSVAVFNTYRTLARVTVQFTSVFSLSLWVEFASKFAQGGSRGVAAMYTRASKLGAMIAVGMGLGTYLFGPWILHFWTHDRIAFAPGLMVILVVYAVTAGLWHVPRVLLQSTNQHIQLARWTLASAMSSVGLAYALGQWLQLDGVGLGVLLAEAGIAAGCSWLAHRFVSTPHAAAAVQAA